MPDLTRIVFSLAAFCAACALVVLFGPSTTAVTATALAAPVVIQDNPVEATESVASGLRVYGRFCRSCHGMQGDGRGMAAPAGSQPANLIDDQWDHGDTDAAIYKVIQEGVAPKYDMDAWEGRITDEEIWHLVNYLRDLGSE